VRTTPKPTTLAVAVKPGAKAMALTFSRGIVSVRVKELPHEGRANEACRKALANALGVALSTVTLICGARTRVKVFALTSLSPADVAARLGRLRS
jgi:uncharacterized protein YggU (UPF0235/DUF167 family)